MECGEAKRTLLGWIEIGGISVYHIPKTYIVCVYTCIYTHICIFIHMNVYTCVHYLALSAEGAKKQ